ncbi:hypothetical protein [Actinomadura sp. 7K507]|uniref:hypothetical protein n=1 Tax=Actinomadura sp. 7K507 TaxID=2530365 RepID=UPI00104E12EA|nr:hypothetical protein [Actinomadura sp. 7K507]TDC84064.1 hypothetical protein E1285_27500 [Actinomadura sp. 7K507]
MTAYDLTVVNESELAHGGPTFAVVAELPEARTAGALSVAWLTQVIHPGNRYTYRWAIEWGFAWSASGTAKDYQWAANGSLPADPASSTQCAVGFDYTGGDFQLKPVTRSPAPNNSQLWVEDSSAIPEPSIQPSSVAVTLNGQPTCVTEAGPNLEHIFTLHPSYYIVAGAFEQGQIIDVAGLTQVQELEYDDGVAALTVVLNDDNTWKVTAGTARDPARR